MLWYIKLGLIAVAFAACMFGIHMYDEGIRKTQKEADDARYNKALIAAQADALAQTTAWTKLTKEKDDATTKAIKDRDTRYGAVVASNGKLRDDLANLSIRASQLTSAACAEGIKTLSTVFGQCLDRYSAMGSHATGQLIDSEDCRAKWPEATTNEGVDNAIRP
jgi:hypothetical protein